MSHRDRLVPRSELLDAVWPGLHVSDTTVASTLHEVRAALRSNGEVAEMVRTVHGLGYRFVADVAVIQPAGLDDEGKPRAKQGFVGRHDVLREAEVWLDDAQLGNGHAFVLAGEQGIGKSRLLLELCRRAQARGLHVQNVRCLPDEGVPRYWPWTEIVRCLLGPGGLDLPRADWESRYGPGITVLLAPQAHQAGLPPLDGSAAAHFQVSDSVARVVREAARVQPLVLAFDDLHHADLLSASLLRHVIGRLSDAPVLLLGALRAQELPAGHALEFLFAELHHAGRVISLAPLDAGEVADLAAMLVGQVLAIEVVAVLRARTGGNPLLVEALTRALALQGGLDDVEGAARATMPTLEVPSAARRANSALHEGSRSIRASAVRTLRLPRSPLRAP